MKSVNERVVAVGICCHMREVRNSSLNYSILIKCINQLGYRNTFCAFVDWLSRHSQYDKCATFHKCVNKTYSRGDASTCTAGPLPGCAAHTLFEGNVLGYFPSLASLEGSYSIYVHSAPKNSFMVIHLNLHSTLTWPKNYAGREVCINHTRDKCIDMRTSFIGLHSTLARPQSSKWCGRGNSAEV